MVMQENIACLPGSKEGHRTCSLARCAWSSAVDRKTAYSSMLTRAGAFYLLRTMFVAAFLGMSITIVALAQ